MRGGPAPISTACGTIRRSAPWPICGFRRRVEYGLCLAALGRFEEARGELQRYVEQASTRQRGEFWDGEAMAAIAGACDALGEQDAAQRIYALLADHADSDAERAAWLAKIEQDNAG